MTTYLQLQTKVSEAIQDPNQLTFQASTVKAIISAAYAEIGRIAPERFQEDITPIADTLSYVLRNADFGYLVDEIEVQRVELWDASYTPSRPFRFVEPQTSHPGGLSYSQAGWVNWGGRLELPNRVVDLIDPTKHVIRVWGYSPFKPLVNDGDVVPFGAEREEALTLYCYVETLRRLVSNRSLFTQWQTRSNNTDVSMASLMTDLNIAQEEWRRKAHAIFVLREAP